MCLPCPGSRSSCVTAASWNEGAEPRWPPAKLDVRRGAGSWMGGRLCPKDSSAPCSALPGCPERDPTSRAAPGGEGSAAPAIPVGSSGGAGTVQRDRGHLSLPLLAGGDSDGGEAAREAAARGTEQPLPQGEGRTSLTPRVVLGAPWTPVPTGTLCYTALATLGAFCTKRDFAEFSAVMLGLRSLEWGFQSLFPQLGG